MVGGLPTGVAMNQAPSSTLSSSSPTATAVPSVAVPSAPDPAKSTSPAPPTSADPSATAPIDPGSLIDSILVNQSRGNPTVACDDRTVIINGSLNQITVRGTCQEVLINGSLNHIRLDGVGSIDINGAKNEITWTAGPDDSAPVVTDRGYGNLIKKG